MNLPELQNDPQGESQNNTDFIGAAIPHHKFVCNHRPMVYEGVPFWMAQHIRTGQWHLMPCLGVDKDRAAKAPPPPVFDTLEEAWQWALLVHASTAETLKD